MNIKKIFKATAFLLIATFTFMALASCSDDDDDSSSGGGNGERGNAPYIIYTYSERGKDYKACTFVFDPSAYILKAGDDGLLETDKLDDREPLAYLMCNGNRWQVNDNYALYLNSDGEIEITFDVSELEDKIGEDADGNFPFKFYTTTGNYYGYDDMKGSVKKTISSNYYCSDGQGGNGHNFKVEWK